MADIASGSASSGLFTRLAPALFVVLWSSGFIVARLVAPHSDPLTFLVVRYALVIAILAPFALLIGAPWPKGRDFTNNAVSGFLLHGVYLGGIFWAVKHGLPAGFAGLFAGLQPLVTATLAGPLLGEAVSGRRWAGIGLGFVGAALVLLPKIGGHDAIPAQALIVGVLAVGAFTAGTIWQKRTGNSMDMRTGNVVQFTAALLPTALVAALTESGRFDMTPELIAGLFWAVIGLSIGAITMLLVMIKRGAVVQTTSLLYLVPAVTALMAWIGFGETMNVLQIGGMVLAAAGVFLANQK
ncbi:DMT family transporter [Flaviflagellibacter deserti]|uniref:DMT family transporter n=1 Tax=Flaviflagellibacter deserti TaxID=2267266 RepID=A0ABV9Z3U8_9HYPH